MRESVQHVWARHEAFTGASACTPSVCEEGMGWRESPAVSGEQSEKEGGEWTPAPPTGLNPRNLESQESSPSKRTQPWTRTGACTRAEKDEREACFIIIMFRVEAGVGVSRA